MRLDTLERDGGIPKPSGFDLDRTCDCIEPPSCVRPLDAGLLCEPDGRDNVAGSLLTDLTILLPFLQPDFLRSRIHEGVYTVLIAVRDWNGTPNDPKVGVSVRMSVGTGRDTNNLLIPPKFDGEDVWDVDSNSLADGKQYEGRLCHEVACVGPTDVSGYVANGTLVAQFPEIGVAVNTGNGLLTLPFTGATLAAQITGEGTSARLKGELVGRMVADALLTATSALRDPFTNQAVCSNPTTYGFIQSGLCGATDLAQLAADDRTGRPCRALSAVVGFTGSPAKTGVIRGTIQDPSDCPGFVGSCPSR
jgi:hypothetical protein